MPLSTQTPLTLPAAPAPSAASTPAPVQAPGAHPLRLPRDHGLTAAGLMAQAAGTIGMGLSLFASMALVLTGYVPRASRTFFLVAAFIGTIRSVAHILAGMSLAKRSPRLFTHVAIYGALAVVHTIVLIAALPPIHTLPVVGPVVIPALIAVSLGWPAALALLVLRRSNRRLFETASAFEVTVLSSDRGVAHAGVLMVVGGMLMAAAYVVIATLGVVEGALPIVTVALLIVRSLVHVWAGFGAMNRPSAARFETLVAIYRAVAIVATLALVAAVLGKGTGGAFGFLFLVVLAMSWFLGWPFALTGFARAVRALEPHGPGDGPERRLPAPPDGGLTALGYALVWYGTLALGGAIGACWSPIVHPISAAAQLAIAGLCLWAGAELALMTRRWKRAALAFGGVTLVLGVVVLLMPFATPEPPTDGGLLALFAGPSEPEVGARWLGALGAIVLPLMTLALVLRVPHRRSG